MVQNTHRPKSIKLLLKDKIDLPDYEKRKCSNLYSEADLMKLLCDYINDCLIAKGYKECYLYSNIRLFLMSVVCLAAIIALAVLKFPDQIFYIKICLASFAINMFGLFIFELFVVKGSFVFIIDDSGIRSFFDVNLTRSTGDIKLSLTRGGKQASISNYVGKYFDSEGFLVTDTVYKDLMQLIVNIDSCTTHELRNLDG